MNQIALVMIVRDEARCIERCLASARPWVDEMVVLDTGSRDETPRLAAACGAKVSHFTWVDDFARARNAALMLTQATWRLVMDADEWIAEEGASQVADCVACLRSACPDFIGQLTVSSAIEQGQGSRRVEQAPSWLSRVLPAGVRYEGRVHEQPSSTLPRRRLPLVLAHDGYLPDHMRAKQGRNERLLEMALAESPQDAYLHYQLGKDREVGGDFEGAQPSYEKAFSLAAPDAPWRHDLILRWMFTLKKLEAFEQALQLARREMPQWPQSPDFFFTLGDLFLDWAQHEAGRAVELMPMIEDSWLRAVQIGEHPELPDTVRGRGSFLAAHNLAVFYESLGMPEQARAWREAEARMRGESVGN